MEDFLFAIIVVGLALWRYYVFLQPATEAE